MLVVACPAPAGAIEPAPLTCLPFAERDEASLVLTAYWAADDRYYVRAERADGADAWFRIETGAGDLATEASRLNGNDAVLGHLGPREGGVAFPAGSSGRTVFRVWRAKGAERPGRTRILAVRAARSRRLPA
jgi:hypothetical protein